MCSQIWSQTYNDNYETSFEHNRNNKMNDRYLSMLSVIWDVISRPNYGMIVAVLVIVLLQFRSNVSSFVYIALDEGIKQTFFNLILNLADIIRGYYQISRELIRSVGNYAQNPFPQVDSIHIQNSDNGRSGNRNFLQRGKRILSYGPPPPLMTMKKVESPVINTTSSATSVNGLKPLEPAFLNEDDYPPNWLVFHPTLGVISRHYKTGGSESTGPAPDADKDAI